VLTKAKTEQSLTMFKSQIVEDRRTGSSVRGGRLKK